VLGSLLGLGVERDVLGDIIMTDERSAVVICDAKMVSFFESGLSRVGRDTVKIKRISLDGLVLPERKTAPISDTVASPRLDCVVAALCSISRERAKERILASAVELNYVIEERPDREVVAPTVLSIRGVGKFKVLSVCERTKKGRLRLLAEKYL
jgi:RNA-binding protein YlmH